MSFNFICLSSRSVLNSMFNRIKIAPQLVN
uniref:Uncharacterized protein n=1 Tax=Staphylococcus phage HS15 TaxID=3056405 RepID=A0AA50AF04_9VIRU|nr:MAG: hypothetical protein [Staphylococcus phage HS15]DAI76950.1 MAG TPA: hypothetical protein [Caudoviricetes sp.]